MLSELYLASAVLKYFHDQGNPASDSDHVQWCVETCLARLQVACDGLLDNFPIRWLGKFFRWIIFPWGTSYKKPRDMTCHNIVTQMTTPSSMRDRITQYCYVDKNPDDSMRRLENTLTNLAETDPLWKKFHKALRSGPLPVQNSIIENIDALLKAEMLTSKEAEDLCDSYALYKEVIRVDEFSFDLSRVIT
jgi:acyl-CoA dehydrogenase